MSLATADLPSDPEALRAFALACQAELKAAQLSVQLRALEIEKLKFQIAKLRRMQFGRSSERITRQIEQLELQLEELETGEAEDITKAEAEDRPAPTRERAKPKRKPLADHLLRQEVVHEPADNGACTCPDCGGGMARLGEDVTEVLDYVPGHFQVIRHLRPKYACKACDAITQAPAPAMPTPRGRATPATLAHLLVSKYCDHLPLYRQSEIYAREGLDLGRSTLCDWVGQAAWLLDPIVEGIRRHVFAAEKIHGDDTTVPVLSPGLGRTKTGRLWVYVRDDRPFCGTAPPAAAYFYSPDRRGEHPAAHMASFTGFLQADAYAGYEALYGPARTKPGPITEVACWAHCRRKIFEVWEDKKSPVAKEAIDRIAAVYAIEAKARFAPVAERVRHRAETGHLLASFFEWAEKVVTKLSTKSDLAEAFRYATNRREALARFVTDGRLEVDNNIAENAIRGIATSESLYPSSSSICKHWDLIFRVKLTRTTFTPHRPNHALGLKVGGPDLIGRARNDLLCGKDAGFDQPADAMAGDAAVLGGVAQGQPRSVLLGRTIGMDAPDAPDVADAAPCPGLALSGWQSHTIQRRGDVLVRPSARHAPDYSQSIVRGAAVMLSALRLTEPKLGVLAALPVYRQDDLAGCLVDVGGNLVHQRSQQLLTRAHGHARCLPRRLEVFGNGRKIRLSQGRDRCLRRVQTRLALLHAA
jgi:transposase